MSREAEEFAALLREVKERSGFSYGVLARKLHTSTSTLHRYCNGDAVPMEYGAVERFARACRATPGELRELRLRWEAADEQRGRKVPAGPPEASGGEAGAEPDASAPSASVPGPEPASAPEAPPPASAPEPEVAHRPEEISAVSGPLPPGGVDGSGSRPTRRRTLLAGVAVVLVAVVAVLLTRAQIEGNDDGRQRETTAFGGEEEREGTVVTDDAGVPHGPERPPSPNAPDGTGGTEAADDAAVPDDPVDGGTLPPPRTPEETRERTGTDPAPVGDPAPVRVSTRPHAFPDPCSRRYLLNRPPEEVPPPPFEQDAPAWVAASGAVTAEEQFVEITVQGVGEGTVILRDLHVRLVAKGAPLPWNDYGTGVGCGGNVPTHELEVDLDAGRPVAVPGSDLHAFPHKVSGDDPLVLYVTAHTDDHDVRWYLELEWVAGDRHGTVRVDDGGEPFRTSGARGRPAYVYPLGADGWTEAPPGGG
ncbi:helix-turn-helix domain-containing protein [Streptomyces alkaliphilus]|uniref:Helix-turn-helix domain-containing protein n=1 Tax=Streptomyces alkaliphilus TaxID=1472722 RepID=A0A7W3TC49_9ACTN|nr:helix-turn-helix transcriptional regulator [Streptomyces alkaliphilus]MBB0243765.1 helix-turn-helix domain-containing protein [Streptomyces alkaliphilus]